MREYQENFCKDLDEMWTLYLVYACVDAQIFTKKNNWVHIVSMSELVCVFSVSNFPEICVFTAQQSKQDEMTGNSEQTVNKH